ncbi:MAG: succinylglutamate desuccinylase/aspartoacylase family protein [Nanoarchaeota archaeon]|nr:succinylglutamate desuccinylase/aspartoacylase family protein [Nanoarchaeota archaeon]
MQKLILGSGKPLIGIVGCLHGNETIGSEIIEILKNINPRAGSLILVIANEEAMKQDKRFIGTDLNRCFPGNENGNHEERLAAAISKELGKCDYVIDIHSTTADTESFIVATKKEALKLAQLVPINKIVFMEPVIANGKSLIDHVRCGISIEFSNNVKTETAKEIILKCLQNIGIPESSAPLAEKEIYSVYDILKKGNIHPALANFQQTTLEGDTFYPVLFGEKEYKDILCLKAKKVSTQPSLQFQNT